jgi:dTDP-4-amino-4,6-dideoxy-D-galactose acyltransferase
VTDGGCRLLDWDTAFFGRRIGRCDARSLTPAAADQAVQWAAANAVECLYLLLPATDGDSHHQAERVGFLRVDDRYTYGRALAQVATAPPATVRPFRPADLPVLEVVAGESHTDTRFFADPRFDRERARELYRRWVVRDCSERPADVLVADDRGRAEGYVTCDRAADGGGQIGLIAVSGTARGRGLGAALVAAALARFAAAGLGDCTVVTQGRNQSARRLYERAGFELRRAEVWFHRWFDPTERN